MMIYVQSNQHHLEVHHWKDLNVEMEVDTNALDEGHNLEAARILHLKKIGRP